MIEVACAHNGGTDLPIRALPEDDAITFPVASMADMHRSYQRITVEQVEQGILAEQLGFHYYFLTEHHFQPEGAEYSPNPIQTGTALAMKTNRIRIGQMANILHRHHPLRLAEQAGALDVLSGGRLEFGVGRGGGTRETEPFGQSYGSSDVDQARSHAYFDEALDIILKAWTEPSFSYQGQFFTIPPRWTVWPSEVTQAYFSQPGLERSVDQIVGQREGVKLLKELSVYPQPLQKPYPQIWQSVVNPATCRWAARRGFNVCCPGVGRKDLRGLLESYYDEAAKHDWPDRLGRGQFKFGWDSAQKRGVCFLRLVHISDDISREKRWGLRHFPNYGAQALLPGIHLPPGISPSYDYYVDGGVALHGSRDMVIENLLADYRAAGFEDYLLFAGFEAAGLSGGEIEEQMRIFAEEVMPVLRRECGGSPEPEPSPEALGSAEGV